MQETIKAIPNSIAASKKERRSINDWLQSFSKLLIRTFLKNLGSSAPGTEKGPA